MGLNNLNCHGLVEVENTIHYHFVMSVVQGWLLHSTYLLQGHKYIFDISLFSNSNGTDETFVTKVPSKVWTWILCTVLVVCVLFP